MKRVLIGLGGIFILVLVAALVVPLFLPKDAIRREIVAQVEEATGWRLRIDGPVGLSLLPSFNMTARDVGLSGEAGADGIEFVRIRQIDFSLALAALFGGEARITGITLVEPKILLETDAWGRTSWEPRRVLPHEISGDRDPLAEVLAESAEPSAPEAAPEPAAEEPSGAVAVLRRIRLDALTLVDGELIWSDRRSGARHELHAVNATLAVPSLDSAATLEGSLTYRNVPLTVAGEVAAPLAMAQGEPGDVALTVSNDQATVRLAGTLDPAPLGGTFTLDADGASMAGLLSAFDVPTGGVTGLDAFAVKATASLDPAQVAVSDIAAALGETVLKGSLTADISGSRPAIAADFAIAEIDLDHYRAAAPASAQEAQAPAADGTPTPAAKPGAQQEAAGAGAATPVDLSGLAAVDAEITLKVGKLKGSGVEVANLDLTATVRDGALALDLADVQAFGGHAGFTARASQRGEEAVVAGTLGAEGIDVAQLMALAGRSEPLAGTLMAKLSYASEGATREALIANLELQGKTGLSDGSYAGLGLRDALGGDEAADRVDDIDVELAIAALDQPVRASGGLSWRGERFAVDATASPARLMAGGRAPVDATLKGKRVTAGIKGEASADGSFDGRVSLDTPNLRGLLAWIGRPVGTGGGLQAFSVSGRFDVSPKALDFSDTVISLDGTSGRGEGRVDLSGARPRLSASFDLDRILLDPYFGGGSGGGPGAGAGGGGAGAGAGSSAGGWSTEPIDFSGLKALDATVDLSTRAIVWDKVNIGASTLKLALKDGRLLAELERLSLYEGRGSGHVVLDGAGAVPHVQARLQVTDVAAFPLLRDAAGFKWIEGTAALEWDVEASGRSQAELVSALSGSASTRFFDGAIRGINIPKMVRGLSVQTLLGWNSGEAEKTDFSELSGTFAIENGIARNDDLKLVGPLVRISGGGVTDMPRQYLEWRVEPRVVASLQGQGAGDASLAGLGVPVVIRGPWSKPQIYPDIAGILENPDAAYKELQKLGGGLVEVLKKDPGKAVEEVVKQATDGVAGGIDVQKVLDGEADPDAVLKALEDGFKLPSGIFGLGKKN